MTPQARIMNPEARIMNPEAHMHRVLGEEVTSPLLDEPITLLLTPRQMVHLMNAAYWEMWRESTPSTSADPVLMAMQEFERALAGTLPRLSATVVLAATELKTDQEKKRLAMPRRR